MMYLTARARDNTNETALSFKLVFVLTLITVIGGCGDHSIPPFGLDERREMVELAFPEMLPHPTPLKMERAFPNLVFELPIFFAVAPDGTNRNFVVGQRGLIYVFQDDNTTSTKKIFLDLVGVARHDAFEDGMLGLAFAPDFATSGLFFVTYTTRDNQNNVFFVLDRYRVSPGDPDRADSASRVEILRVPHPSHDHNGGMIEFGPDGYLYVSIGDGGSYYDSFNNAQDRKTLLGSILRIDVSTLPYTVPADNPFVGEGGGVREEIWAYGLRNPWRFSFDRASGQLWCGDVGQDNEEEINLIESGDNLGWPLYEGTIELWSRPGFPATNLKPPTYSYPITEGRAVIGGYVYRGPRIPSLAGAYIYGDYMSGRIWALTHDGIKVTGNTELANVLQITGFGEDRTNDLIVTSFADGSLWRFAEPENIEEPRDFPETLSATGLFSDTAKLITNPGLIEYDVKVPYWSDGAQKRRWIGLPQKSQIKFSSDGAWTFPYGTVLVKHFELPLADGTIRRVETRVLLRAREGWGGYVYRWNDAQTDAELLPLGATDVFQVADPDAPGGVREQMWTYPGRTDCLKCHTESAGFVLGVTTRQINRKFNYPTAPDNQLRAWNHIGLFTTDIGNPLHPTYPDIHNQNIDPSERARVYLDVNCANCHRPGGPTGQNLDLRLSTPRGEMEVIDVLPWRGDSSLENPARVRPGVKESSVLWERMRQSTMPPIGHHVADAFGIDLVGKWIDAGAE